MAYKYFFNPQPITQRKNEYIDHFYDTLAKKVNLLNYGKKAISRSIDYLRYSIRADVMILNWPEDILHLRFGILQLFSSFIIITFFKIKGGKIVWICHNRESHKKNLKWLRKLTRSFYTKISDVIIVLSKDALDHFSEIKHKVHFLNHPVYLNPGIIKEDNTEAYIDVLIWGHISPYKGLNEFIEAYKKNNQSFGVKIIGHANKQYLEIIKQKADGLNIDIIDKFLTEKELVHYFNASKIIVLPYQNRDTFSSGALIHSLCSNKIIIGAAVGNFIDLHQYGACLVYEDLKNLFTIIDSLLENQRYYNEELTRLRWGIRDYYDSNSWEYFVDKVLNIVGNK
ncbi:MAG: glycosyltransferase [Ginsengibacter sp.]